MALSEKYESLLAVIADNPGYVAFSGGVDSSLVLRAAFEVLGKRVKAFFANSILQREVDVANAILIAELIGADLEVVDLSPLEWPEFKANPPDRCYLCKKKVYGIFIDLIPKREGMKLLDGTNIDDRTTTRPGHKAIDELGVFTPLVKAGFGKEEIRQMAKSLGLPNWNRNSASCLATRVSHGSLITLEKLDKIYSCEKVLSKLGFAGCRAKLSEDQRSVIIEVREEDLETVSSHQIRHEILSSLAALDIDKISLDLAGR